MLSSCATPFRVLCCFCPVRYEHPPIGCFYACWCFLFGLVYLLRSNHSSFSVMQIFFLKVFDVPTRTISWNSSRALLPGTLFFFLVIVKYFCASSKQVEILVLFGFSDFALRNVVFVGLPCDVPHTQGTKEWNIAWNSQEEMDSLFEIINQLFSINP